MRDHPEKGKQTPESEPAKIRSLESDVGQPRGLDRSNLARKERDPRARESPSKQDRAGEQRSTQERPEEAPAAVGDGSIEAVGTPRVWRALGRSPSGPLVSSDRQADGHVDRPEPPGFDRALANFENVRREGMELRPTDELLRLADQLDRRVMSGLREDGSAMGPLQRSATVETLFKIYDVVDERVTRAAASGQIDESGRPIVEGVKWPESPMAGAVADIPPFGNADLWATMRVAEQREEARRPSVERDQGSLVQRPEIDSRAETDRIVRAMDARSAIESGFRHTISDNRPEDILGDNRVAAIPYLEQLQGYSDTMRWLLIRPTEDFKSDDLTTKENSGSDHRMFESFREGERRALRTWNAMSEAERRAIRGGTEGGGPEAWETIYALRELYVRESNRITHSR